jgi:VRR-NUC domain
MRRPRQQPELALHRAVAEFLRLCVPPPPAGPWWTHPHGEGRRSKTDAGLAKAMGQQAGTPDLIFCSNGRFLAVELKAPDGRLSPAQEFTHASIRAAGGVVMVCRSLDDVVTVLTAIGVPVRAHLDQRAAPATWYTQ